jgi:hypothetical protein
LKRQSFLLLLLFIAVVSALPVTNQVHAQAPGTPVKIGVVTENRQFGWPGGSDSFYAQGRYWLFFVNSSSNCEGYATADCLNYISSSDGQTWTAATNLNLVAQDPQQDGDYAVIANSTTVTYIRCNCTQSASLNDIMLGTGTLSSTGAITTQTEIMVAQNTTATEDFYGLTLTRSTTGRVFAGFIDCTGTCNASPTSKSKVEYSDSTQALARYLPGSGLFNKGAFYTGGGYVDQGICFTTPATGSYALNDTIFDLSSAGAPTAGVFRASLYAATGPPSSTCTPTGSILDSTATLSLGVTPGKVKFNFSPGYSLQTGSNYALSLQLTSCGSCDSSDAWLFEGHSLTGAYSYNAFIIGGPYGTSSGSLPYYQIDASSFTGSTVLVCSGTSDGSCPPTGAAYTRVVLLNQTMGKVYAVSATGTSGLRGFAYNNGWTAQGSISNPTGYNPGCSGFTNIYNAIAVQGDLLATFWPPTTDATTCLNENPGGTWQTSQAFFNFAPCKSGILFSCFSVTYDQNTGNFYMLDYFQSSSNITVYAGTNPISWKPAQTLTTSAANGSDYLRSMQQTVKLNSTSYTVPAWFTTGTSSPYGLYYIVLPETITPSPGQGNEPPPPIGANQPVPLFQTTHVLILGFNLTVPVQLVAKDTVVVIGALALFTLGSALIYDIDKERRKRQPASLRSRHERKASLT